MFDVEKIQDGLSGLVAVRQPLNPDYDKLSSGQYVSTSGLYLDDVQHFKLEYWIDAQSYASASDNDLQTAWSNLEKSTIAGVMARVFNRPTYIDRNLIYINAYDRNETRTLDASGTHFYGYRLKVSDRKNLAFAITNVRIEGVAVAPDQEITVVLYNSSNPFPIKSQAITLDTGGSIQKEVLNWYIDNSGEYYKGEYFLGFQMPSGSDFKPYMRNYNRSNIVSHISELEISAIHRDGSFADLEDMEMDDEHNGLNFDITVYEDYTDLIIQNKFMFAQAIQLHWAMSVLLMAVSSNRSNRNERISKEFMQLILLSIDGQRGYGLPTIVGLREQVNGEISRLNEELKKLIDGYFTGTLDVSTLC